MLLSILNAQHRPHGGGEACLSHPSRGEPQPPSCLRVTGGDAREEARLASRLPQAGPGSLFPRLFQAWDTPLVGGGGVGSGSDHHMRIF